MKNVNWGDAAKGAAAGAVLILILLFVWPAWGTLKSTATQQATTSGQQAAESVQVEWCVTNARNDDDLTEKREAISATRGAAAKGNQVRDFGWAPNNSSTRVNQACAAAVEQMQPA